MNPDLTNDDAGASGGADDQQNAVNNWYEPLAGDNQERVELLSKFDSPDAFLEDYNKRGDWRSQIAGDDDKFKSTLERFAEPQALGNAFREAQQKIRSGQLRPELPEDATEDQVKAFREANNIPLDPEGYFESLPDGLVIGEEDKQIMGELFSELHGVNAPPAVTAKIAEWYSKWEESNQSALQEVDAKQAREVTDILRDSEDGWGKDYRVNLNMVKSAITKYLGDEGGEALMNGRFSDGTGFMNNPVVLKGLAQWAREVNEYAPLIEQDQTAVQSLHDEIAGIEAKMGTSEYKKDEAMQARLRELYDIRLKFDKSNAA